MTSSWRWWWPPWLVGVWVVDIVGRAVAPGSVAIGVAAAVDGIPLMLPVCFPFWRGATSCDDMFPYYRWRMADMASEDRISVRLAVGGRGDDGATDVDGGCRWRRSFCDDNAR